MGSKRFPRMSFAVIEASYCLAITDTDKESGGEVCMRAPDVYN